MITNEQIESLYGFCRKHYVRAYDVQVELVDHLTVAIEEKMAADAKLSFEKALELVYLSFGIKGFADIVASRIQSLDKKWKKERWKLFFAYFTLPKLAFTLFIYSMLLVIGSIMPKEYLSNTIMVFVMILLIFDIVCMRITAKKFKKQQKELLYTSTRFEVILHSFFFFQIAINPRLLDSFTSFGESISFMHYSIITFIIVMMFISILAQQQFVKKLYTSAKELYPLAFTS